MNRRKFTTLLACVSILPFMGMNGCQNALELLIQVLGNAVVQLITGIVSPELAQKIRHDTEMIIALVRGWKEGQPAQEIIRSINRLIQDMQTLALPEKFKPLIDLALGTLASIIEHLMAHGGGEQPATKVRITKPPLNAKEFREEWNCIRAGSPDIHEAPVI